MRKWSALLIVIGGLVALVALFLPLGMQVGSGVSLYSLARQQGPRSLTVWSYSQEPLAIVALIVFGLLSFKMGRTAYILSLLSALVGLELLLSAFSRFLSLFYSNLITAWEHRLIDGMTAIKAVLQFLEMGFWLAGLGFILGLVGAIVGLSYRPVMRETGQPALRMSQEQNSPLRLGNVLAFCAGVVAVIVFFLPTPLETLQGVGLLDSRQISLDLALAWPDLLGGVCLIVCSLLAMKMRKIVALCMLSGAVVGLIFQLVIVVVAYAGDIAGLDYNPDIGVAQWLGLVAFIVGIIGALLELRRRPAAVLMAAAAGGG